MQRPVCIDADCVNDWGALKKWSPEYLRRKVGSKRVPVELTPNGRADSVVATGMKETILIIPFHDNLNV